MPHKKDGDHRKHSNHRKDGDHKSKHRDNEKKKEKHRENDHHNKKNMPPPNPDYRPPVGPDYMAGYRDGQMSSMMYGPNMNGVYVPVPVPVGPAVYGRPDMPLYPAPHGLHRPDAIYGRPNEMHSRSKNRQYGYGKSSYAPSGYSRQYNDRQRSADPREHHKAMQRNLHVWSEWRTGVNDKLINHLFTGDTQPIPNIDDALKAKSVYDGNGRVISNPMTLMDYASFDDKLSPLKPKTYLAYGIPRVRPAVSTKSKSQRMGDTDTVESGIYDYQRNISRTPTSARQPPHHRNGYFVDDIPEREDDVLY